MFFFLIFDSLNIAKTFEILEKRQNTYFFNSKVKTFQWASNIPTSPGSTPGGLNFEFIGLPIFWYILEEVIKFLVHCNKCELSNIHRNGVVNLSSWVFFLCLHLIFILNEDTGAWSRPWWCWKIEYSFQDIGLSTSNSMLIYSIYFFEFSLNNTL